MSGINREKFKEFWAKTEIIREYRRALYTFGDIQLPYVLVAEHLRFMDRAVVRKGVMVVQKPHIVLPGYYNGPEFSEGFEHAAALKSEMAYLSRTMGLPYSKISNRPAAEESIEYGSLQDVIDRLKRHMDSQEDTETGLIKGTVDGAEVSLVRYSFGLIVRSAPENIKEFFERAKRHRSEPIRPDERITDEDIRRLFEQ
jgi:hypothetical protein